MPPRQRAAAQPVPCESTTPVNAVKPTTPASTAMVSQTTAVNERRPERRVSAISPTNVARGSARTEQGTLAAKGSGRAEDTLAEPVSTVPTITIDALLDRYDAILFDAYGVLVHGSGPLPGAARAAHPPEPGRPALLRRHQRRVEAAGHGRQPLPAVRPADRRGAHPHVRHAAHRRTSPPPAWAAGAAPCSGRRTACATWRRRRGRGRRPTRPSTCWSSATNRAFRSSTGPTRRCRRCSSRSTRAGRCTWWCRTRI